MWKISFVFADGKMSNNRPPGLGRGGRGAALMQLLNQQVRAPGDAQAGSSQQQPSGAAAFGQSAGATAAPGAQVQTPPMAAPPQPVASQSTGPPGPAARGPVEPGQPSGRGVFFQKVCATQQPLGMTVSSPASEASTETGWCVRGVSS